MGESKTHSSLSLSLSLSLSFFPSLSLSIYIYIYAWGPKDLLTFYLLRASVSTAFLQPRVQVENNILHPFHARTLKIKPTGQNTILTLFTNNTRNKVRMKFKNCQSIKIK